MRVHRIGLIAFFALTLAPLSARAQYDQVAPYDLAKLGLPQFLNANYIDVPKITQLSKFRSDAGHDYSDESEFSTQGLIDPITNKVETCRSMKHYFFGPDVNTGIYAPVAGTITGVETNGTPDVQIGIEPDAQPAFGINIFHVTLDQPLTVGQHVSEGQRLGHFPDPSIYPYVGEDIAVFVKSIQGFHLVSYFDVLTAAALAPWQARGLTTPDSMIVYTAAQRDAAPFQCNGAINPPQLFINTPAPPDSDYFTLTGGATQQSISYGTVPRTLRVGAAPLTLSPTASSGLPVVMSSETPSTCTVSGYTITAVAAGLCSIEFVQPGNATVFETYTAVSITVTAGLNAGPIYSSAQVGLQSFLRFTNTGTSAGTVTALLYDAGTGNSLGQWTSPSIPAGAETQVPISTVEATALPAGKTPPQFYSLVVQSGMTGTFQHVLWRPSAGTLTNLTTCAFGTGYDPMSLSAVHTSLLGASGYASSVVVNNGLTAASVVLDFYDARNGAKVGTYTTAKLPAGASVVLDVAAMETAAKITPAPGMVHYVIKAESPFAGFLQHLLYNAQQGITTDMTTLCSLDSSVFPTALIPMQSSIVYASGNPAAQSYVRFHNGGGFNPDSSGTIAVNLNDPTTGALLGTWTSPNLAYGIAVQYPISTLESALPANTTKPPYYVLTFQSHFNGTFQHVLWNQPAGTLTNLTSCSTGVDTGHAFEMFFVHSSLLTSYPSTLVVNNTTAASAPYGLLYADARNDQIVDNIFDVVLGSPKTIPGNAADVINVAVSEGQGLAIDFINPFVPSPGMDYYIATGGGSPDFYSGSPGYMQHLVTNNQSGVIENMTTMCPLY